LWLKMTPKDVIFRHLVERIGCNEAICHAQLLLMCLDVGNVYIAHNVVVVLRCVLLSDLGESEQVALLLGLVAEVDAEGVVA
jgi:hypothetical protein